MKANYQIINLSHAKSLTKRERRIIAMRLGIGKYKKKLTYEEIGKYTIDPFTGSPMSISRIQVLERNALDKLKKESGVKVINRS